MGIYYLSLETALFKETPDNEAPAFGKIGEIEHALFAKRITLHDKIRARYETDGRGRQPDQTDRGDDSGPHDDRANPAQASRTCRST